MAVVEELLRSEANGTISFGNHTLAAKKKVEDYEHRGDLYKVKTFAEITKLEKNGMFLYESVPGTTVHEFEETAKGVTFLAEGAHSTQITVGLKEDTEYEVVVRGDRIGIVKTNLSGKLNVSVDLKLEDAEVKIVEV
ncbi:MAG: endosialidase [Lachnospiraceae bacterium]|nr:endosialidase [Lachnospiraceae bacterium]